MEEDNTNLHRPMYSAPPGVGHMSPLPQMTVEQSGVLEVTINQKKLVKSYVNKDDQGNEIASPPDPVVIGIQRYGSSEAKVDASYLTASYPPEFSKEGFLVTVYQSSTFGQHAVLTGSDGKPLSYVLSGSGGFQEVVHSHNSNGDISYRNDLALRIYTP